MELRPTKEGQSILDYLLRVMPNLQVQMKANNMVDPLAARSLFSIWKDESNHVHENTYRRPATVSQYQLDAITKAGLAKVNGEKIEITEKGGGVIKVMVLGDNSSIFDERDDKIIDYSQALSNTKKASTRRGKNMTKKASSDWWDRFDK